MMKNFTMRPVDTWYILLKIIFKGRPETFVLTIVVQLLFFSAINIQVNSISQLSVLHEIEISPVLSIFLSMIALFALHIIQYYLDKRLYEYSYSSNFWSHQIITDNDHAPSFIAKGMSAISDLVVSIPKLISILPATALYLWLLNIGTVAYLPMAIMVLSSASTAFVITRWRLKTSKEMIGAVQSRSKSVLAYRENNDIENVKQTIIQELVHRNRETRSEELKNIAPQLVLILTFLALKQIIIIDVGSSVAILLTSLILLSRLNEALEGWIKLKTLDRYDIKLNARMI